jgi:tetratricopeptide (TPR) repeat protein
VDYEKLFPEQYRENRLSGTEALFENKYPIREESNYYPMNKPSYRAKVSWATSYLEKRKYPQALKEMKQLLNLMPEDVNLNFYSGILEFQIGEFDSALKRFELTKTIYPPLFYQEAAWYQALCLKELGRNEEAKQRLVEIVSMDGFYSQDAAKELEEMDAN